MIEVERDLFEPTYDSGDDVQQSKPATSSSDEKTLTFVDTKYRVLSLFANIGVAEAYLEEIGCSVVVANELEKRRAALYSQIYPQSKMICGDITDCNVFDAVIKASKDSGVDIIMATPPCQGMSTAGEQRKDDVRNSLLLPAIRAIQSIVPKYALIENVPNFVNTSILYKGRPRLLLDILYIELSEQYHISVHIENTKDYGVPQSRERMLILLSRRDCAQWRFPRKAKELVTLEKAIGWIPEIDPFVKDISAEELHSLFPLYEERKKVALSISRWNTPPSHVLRQVIAMQHTPTGKSAFDNLVHKPKTLEGKIVRGYKNTFKRQRWDSPAYTITMDNRKISSQGNVHPGRAILASNGSLYSDARVFTLFELMLVMSLPSNWPLPNNANEAFVRRVIGEGIPPLFVKQLFEILCNE